MEKRTVLEEDYLSNQSKKKVRLYSISYPKLGFVPDDQDKNKLYCLLCCKFLCNDSMKNKKTRKQLKNIHPEHVEKPFEYFQRLNERRQKNKQMLLMLIFKNQSNLNNHGLQASYELSLLLAKKSRPHTDGEELLETGF